MRCRLFYLFLFVLHSILIVFVSWFWLWPFSLLRGRCFYGLYCVNEIEWRFYFLGLILLFVVKGWYLPLSIIYLISDVIRISDVSSVHKVLSLSYLDLGRWWICFITVWIKFDEEIINEFLFYNSEIKSQ